MTCRYPDLGSASDWSSRPRKFASANSILMSEMAHVPYYQWFFFLSSKDITILGDPGAVSRVGKCRGRKFASTGKRAPGYGLSPIYFQKFKQMPTPDWAPKNAWYYCAQWANSFSWVRPIARNRRFWSLHGQNLISRTRGTSGHSIKQRKFYNEMWDK